MFEEVFVFRRQHTDWRRRREADRRPFIHYASASTENLPRARLPAGVRWFRKCGPDQVTRSRCGQVITSLPLLTRPVISERPLYVPKQQLNSGLVCIISEYFLQFSLAISEKDVTILPVTSVLRCKPIVLIQPRLTCEHQRRNKYAGRPHRTARKAEADGSQKHRQVRPTGQGGSR